MASKMIINIDAKVILRNYPGRPPLTYNEDDICLKRKLTNELSTEQGCNTSLLLRGAAVSAKKARDRETENVAKKNPVTLNENKTTSKDPTPISAGEAPAFVLRVH